MRNPVRKTEGTAVVNVLGRETSRSKSVIQLDGERRSVTRRPSSASPRSKSYRSARKDVDYKVSETGVSLACVTSSEGEEQAGGPRADVADSDMPLDVQRYAIAVSRDAVRAHRMFREVARYVKRAMDMKFGQCWQCHVGKEFGVRISYVPGSYMFVTLDGQAIILYKSS